jgi:hypothetical protein
LDPDLQKGNDPHKYVIDRLTEAFHALGRKAWQDRRASEPEVHEEDEVDIICSNSFRCCASMLRRWETANMNWTTNTVNMGICTSKKPLMLPEKLHHEKSTLPRNRREEQAKVQYEETHGEHPRLPRQ